MVDKTYVGFELGPFVIANICRNRWQIETFFKWIKGNLIITEISKIIEVSILSKADIRELLDVPAPLTQNQNVNELLINF